jgi:tellurite resistance protein TerC
MCRYHYLKVGLAFVLAFVGVKMILTDLYKVPIVASLAVVAVLLMGPILVSLLRPPAKPLLLPSPSPHPLTR